VHRRILNLAIPNIISNITIPLLGMVDIALMGHLGDQAYIGAVAVGGMIFNFIYWNFSFLRMGTSGFTAQAFGRRDRPESVMILVRALLVAFSVAALLVLLRKPVADLAFRVIGPGPGVELPARDYYNIRIFAAPATLALYAITGWFLGMQNARIPMIIMITVNLLNIGFSLMFVKVYHMTASGIALGTVIAQYGGLILSALFLGRYRHLFFKPKAALLFDKSKLLNFFRVNRDIWIRTLCLIFTLTFFTSQSARTSDTILAANTLLMQFFMLFSFLADGYAHAAEALTGKFIGAGNRQSLRKGIRLLFFWSGGIALVFTVLYITSGRFLLTLLTSNAEVLSSALGYLPWAVIIPLITFPAFIWDGIYIGATASAAMRNSMLVATLAVFLPAYYLLEPSFGNHGLWIAFISFMATRGITLTIMARKAIYTG
jgi:multidrug resistance protein, MATE family